MAGAADWPRGLDVRATMDLAHTCPKCHGTGRVSRRQGTPTMCSVPGCPSYSAFAGMCSRHYKQRRPKLLKRKTK